MKFENESGWNHIIIVAAGVTILFFGWADSAPDGYGVFLRYFGLLPLITGLVGFYPVNHLLELQKVKED